MRTLPETANRQDWPRLVSQTVNDNGRNIAFLLAPPPLSLTTSGTVTVSDRFILADATGAPIVVTLPVAADSAGAILTVKKVDTTANSVTIDANSSELIDGSTTAVISVPYTSVTLYCDGSQWWIV